jgi:hypothetical protein
VTVTFGGILAGSLSSWLELDLVLSGTETFGCVFVLTGTTFGSLTGWLFLAEVLFASGR